MKAVTLMKSKMNSPVPGKRELVTRLALSCQGCVSVMDWSMVVADTGGDGVKGKAWRSPDAVVMGAI